MGRVRKFLAVAKKCSEKGSMSCNPPSTQAIPSALSGPQWDALYRVPTLHGLSAFEETAVRQATNRLHFLESRNTQLSVENERLQGEVKDNVARSDAWRAVSERLHKLPEYEAVNQKRPGLCGLDHAIGVIDELVANNQRLTERVTQLKGLAHGYFYGAGPAKILGTTEVVRVSPDASRVRITAGEGINAFSVELSRNAWVNLFRLRQTTEAKVARLEKEVAELTQQRDTAQKNFVQAAAGQDVLRAQLSKRPCTAPTPPDGYTLRPAYEYVQDGDIVYDHTVISPQWKTVTNVDIINGSGSAPYGRTLRSLYHYARPLTADDVNWAKAIAEMKAVSESIDGVFPPLGHRLLRPGEKVERGDKARHLDSLFNDTEEWQDVSGSIGRTVSGNHRYGSYRTYYARPV